LTFGGDRIPGHLRGLALSAGRPDPLGATFDGEGVNFAIFSANADKIELCLFSDDGRKELARIAMGERDGDVWHIYVAGLTPGTRYGYRVHGPYRPEEGHRFNPNKLLLDPYAKKLTGGLKWSDAVMGYRVGSPRADLSFDTRDSAFAVPKSVVVDPSFSWGGDRNPRITRSSTVLYEAHIRGVTMQHPGVDPALRGTCLGLASDPVIEHLLKLGVTTIQIMPLHAYVDDRFLVSANLRNYWGYNSIGFFAPDPRYLREDAIWEVQAMVRRFHSAGIEVILDVVYNHTAEGNEMGATLSFRGIDNCSYYRLHQGGRYYVNDTGTGNTLNVAHPMVLRMVMDSLRYWVETFHVDGFRFDLGTVLAREPHGFDTNGSFLDAMRQDPVLSRVKLITEPWDLGPGGYQLGAFPHPFLEFNDRFRDGVRKFWKGEAGVSELSRRISGSAENFDHSGRAATSSINFVTVHDGFTLEDVVSYNVKHNEANGEGNRDGKDDNYSDNMGVEGPTSNPAIMAARAQRKRNLIATVLLSQGTPFLLAGDEFGNSQGGNNNVYAQDNETGWLDWARRDLAFQRFVERLIALRKTHPVLRQRLFLHSRPRRSDGIPDLYWRLPDGSPPGEGDWARADWRCLCVEVRTSSATPDYAASDDVLFLVFNGGGATEVKLPDRQFVWEQILDTAHPDDGRVALRPGTVKVAADSVVVFARGAS
jgi:isoamylase